MHLPSPRFRPLPLGYKVIGIVLIACFLLIGLVGLILPIIPGLLFLFLAFYLLTRVSQRASAYAHSQPWISRHMRQMDAADKLTIGERVRLGLLVVARSAVNGIAWCIAALKGDGKRS
ncbi:MAG: DUF454 family protein [Gammaproteobacteria bacterium]|nr:DUF454 family protein [Gammaproteobacteria bacterium]MDP2348783.1 DUF454 family protein [Gammaproteobacteria bacterium]